LLYSKTLTKKRNQKDGNYPLTLEASLEVLADAKIIKKLEKNAGRGACKCLLAIISTSTPPP
jgi:hypothetical protein